MICTNTNHGNAIRIYTICIHTICIYTICMHTYTNLYMWIHINTNCIVIDQSMTSSDRTWGIKLAFYLAYMERWPMSTWMRMMAAIYNQSRLYIDWHHYLINRDQIGSRINGCTLTNWLWSTWIVDVDNRFDVWFDGRFNGQFDGWFDSWFDLAELGYQPQQSVWQLRQEAKQPRCFTGSFYRLVVLRALNGYQPRGQ